MYKLDLEKAEEQEIKLPTSIGPWKNQANSKEMVSEKAMAPHSSTLAWKILWTEEPGRLQSMGSLSVGHDRATSLHLV